MRPDAIAVADFNGDGRDDVAGQGLHLFLQQPDGTLQRQPSAMRVLYWPDDLLARDLDGDGDTDLAVVGGQSPKHEYQYVVEVFVQVVPAVFIREECVLPDLFSNFSSHDHLAVCDVNADGLRDLVVGVDEGAVVKADADTIAEKLLHAVT